MNSITARSPDPLKLVGISDQGAVPTEQKTEESVPPTDISVSLAPEKQYEFTPVKSGFAYNVFQAATMALSAGVMFHDGARAVAGVAEEVAVGGKKSFFGDAGEVIANTLSAETQNPELAAREENEPSISEEPTLQQVESEAGVGEKNTKKLSRTGVSLTAKKESKSIKDLSYALFDKLLAITGETPNELIVDKKALEIAASVNKKSANPEARLNAIAFKIETDAQRIEAEKQTKKDRLVTSGVGFDVAEAVVRNETKDAGKTQSIDSLPPSVMAAISGISLDFQKSLAQITNPHAALPPAPERVVELLPMGGFSRGGSVGRSMSA